MQSDVFNPAKRRVGRRRRPVVSSSPAPAGPVLVSAGFEGGALTLMFDRAIDIAGLNFLGVFVMDGTVPVEWNGTANIEPVGENGVMILMIENAEYAGEGIRLNVPGGAGIVSLDDGASWDGVMGLALPYS